MLPDVGMVKTYPKYVSWGRRMLTRLLRCGIHLLVPGLFPPVGFSCSYPWLQRHSPPSLHHYLFLWETFLLPLYVHITHNANFPHTESMYTVTHVAVQSPLPPSSPPLTKSPWLPVVLTISIVMCLIFITEIHIIQLLQIEWIVVITLCAYSIPYCGKIWQAIHWWNAWFLASSKYYVWWIAP